MQPAIGSQSGSASDAPTATALVTEMNSHPDLWELNDAVFRRGVSHLNGVSAR